MESHLDGLARDFLYALRNLRKNRRFSLVAIFTLALGIGTTTVMFSVIYSVIVDALPYKNFELRRFREVTIPRPPRLILLRFSRHTRTRGFLL